MLNPSFLAISIKFVQTISFPASEAQQSSSDYSTKDNDDEITGGDNPIEEIQWF